MRGGARMAKKKDKKNVREVFREVFSEFFCRGGAPMHKTKNRGDRDLSAVKFSAQYDAWSSKKEKKRIYGNRQHIGKNR